MLTNRYIRPCLLLCTLIATFTFVLPQSIYAELLPIGNNDLDQITGQSGLSLAIKNVQLFGFVDSFHYYGSDNGYLQLDNIKLNDGSGGVTHFNYDFGTAVTSTGIVYMDIGTPEVASVDDWTGNSPTSISRVMGAISAPNWDQDLTYTVGNFIFGDPTSSYGSIDLGALELGPINMNSFDYYYSQPIGGIGINWEDDFQLHIDHATYQYQTNSTTSKRIILTHLYMGDSFSDYAGDDPSAPSTWKPNNNVDYGQFKIGDLFGDVSTNLPSNPAKFDVGETATGSGNATFPGLGMAVVSTPLIGSIRFEDVQFGDADFGPGAIDGIHAYRLEMRLIP